MSQLMDAIRQRGWIALFAVFLFGLLPNLALAAGDANVVIEFSQQDQIYLYISLGLGIVAILFGLWLRSSVLRMTPGDEKMQAVGSAIHEGAIAYLKKQVTTMGIFVVALAIILFLIYSQTYKSPTLGGLTALCFVLGVAASYIAGYIGMDVAVRGNMRTAAAALTSYKSSLEVAFRSGAVAGMMTVGLGLLGATVIFLVAGKDAMKLLIGFGFGGSLAALFMRVGGGIFTKAADVGADLVGKVEAGIPEDDPRNPAVIADNVGDNVGDCAGMAADVFESYEVTLVAAIVLGAATAAIFDTSTWMKLILFALMARGVGIVASIIGILMVKGSDNVDSDPLKPIRRGFWNSAVLAAIMTAVLAFFMMGGQGSPIKTSIASSQGAAVLELYDEIAAIRAKMAKEKGVTPDQISTKDLKARSEVKTLGIPEGQTDQVIDQIAMQPRESLATQAKDFSSFRAVPLEKVDGVSAMKVNFQTNQNEYLTVQQVFEKARWYKIKGTPDPKAAVPPGQPKPTTQEIYVLTNDKPGLDNMIKGAGGSGMAFTYEGPADGVKPIFFQNREKDLVVGIAGTKEDLRFNARPLMTQEQLYKMSKADLEKAMEARKKASDEVQAMYKQADTLKGDAQVKKREEANKKQQELADLPQPRALTYDVGIVTEKPVPWYLFALCIVFGIFMAFAIEFLTDYYVSTHKKPVQEIAGVSTAGPAPMIIQGFALGAESSVFSVFAIVAALIAPMLIFPPADFGGYILSFYGIALVGLGLLTTTGYILAMDTFGPISDNAQGVFEMSGAGHNNPTASKAVQRLDAAGNTTKALTKGFAIATAVVAAVALFHSFVEDARLTGVGMRLEIPEIFLGLLIGGAAPYLFSAFSINAVGRAAFELINEVRRQFRNDPGIMAGTSKPNYASCVAIVTQAAQKELLGPGVLAIALPVAVAFGFSIGKPLTTIGGAEYNLVGAQALGGFLAGCILSGQLMAVLLANSGGMWDNAKKLIEDGMYGGKGTDAHKAAVVCDTVGDPFKDTAGPALNPLIKVMNLVALLLAPVVIAPHPTAVQVTVTVICLAALAFSIWWSKRGSMSSAMEAAGGGDSSLPPSGGDSTPTSPDRGRITVD